MAAVTAALARPEASRGTDTPFVGRPDVADRHRDAREVGKTYTPSQDRRAHEAMASFPMYRSGFRRPVRTPSGRSDGGPWRRRAPAIAAGPADRVRTIRDRIMMPRIQRR